MTAQEDDQPPGLPFFPHIKLTVSRGVVFFIDVADQVKENLGRGK